MYNKIAIIIVVIACVLPVASFATTKEEAVAKAIDEAIEKAVIEAVNRLSEADLPEITRIAIGPVRGQEGKSIREYLQAHGTKSGYEIYVRGDDDWNMLLKEIAWGVRKDDIMDQDTIQKFGRIQGVEAFIYGTVKDVSVETLEVTAKILLNLAVVETGQNAWGDSFEETVPINYDLIEVSKPYWKYIIYAIAGLIVLGVIAKIFRSVGQPR